MSSCFVADGKTDIQFHTRVGTIRNIQEVSSITSTECLKNSTKTNISTKLAWFSFIREFFPQKDSSRQCTALYLQFNLAKFEWKNIGCTEKLFPDFICHGTNLKDQTATLAISPSKTGCSVFAFVKSNICHLFHWVDGSFSLVNTTCHEHNMSPNKMRNISSFNFVFNAVHPHHFVLFLLSPNGTSTKMFMYERLWLNDKYRAYEVHVNKIEGHVVCSAEKQNLIVASGNFFHCNNDKIISSLLVIDGVSDCNESGLQTSSDEVCPLHKSQCPLECHSQHCVCSPLHFKSRGKHCRKFADTSKSDRRPVLHKEEFSCDPNRKVDIDLANDLVSDCGRSAADEPLLKRLLLDEVFLECPKAQQVPCKQGHPKCYSISETCIYHLDERNHLTPCRTGAHVENCEQFECNMHFKCPKFYCIPWHYVCDSKWDCPHGYDEMEIHQCGAERPCSNLFGCRYSQVCVHVLQVCDGKRDCPSSDDEFLCHLSTQVCPHKCTCLISAIFCTEVQGVDVELSQSQYFSYHLSICALQNLKFIQRSVLSTQLHLFGNKVSKICNILQHFHRLTSVGFESNDITILTTKCFNQLSSVQLINVRNNKIAHMENRVFANIKKINILDFSQNGLHMMFSSVFHNVSLISELNVSYNPFTQLSMNMFHDIPAAVFSTTRRSVCCVLSEDTKCVSVPVFADSQCMPIFPQRGMKIVSGLCAITILILTLTVGCRTIVRKGWSKRGPRVALSPYNMLILAVNCGCMMYGLMLLALFLSDAIHQESIVLKQKQRQKSIPCFVTFLLSLQHNLLVPYFLCFISLARLLVVVNPLKSRFKYKGFVMRHVIFGCALVTAISFTLTVYLQRKVSSNLCSPFTDGNKPKEILSTNISFLVVFCCATLFMSTTYCVLVKQIEVSRKCLRRKANQQTSLLNIAKLSILVVSNGTFWVTSVVIFLCGQTSSSYPRDLMVWNTITICSLPALFNPIFFSCLLHR